MPPDLLDNCLQSFPPSQIPRSTPDLCVHCLGDRFLVWNSKVKNCVTEIKDMLCTKYIKTLCYIKKHRNIMRKMHEHHARNARMLAMLKMHKHFAQNVMLKMQKRYAQNAEILC